MRAINLPDALRWEASGPHPRERGEVLWFKSANGHGRIKADQDNEILVVVFHEIRSDGFRTLKEGQRVEFQRAPAPDRWHARDVHVLPDPAKPGAAQEQQ